jgi:hypothetical protein
MWWEPVIVVGDPAIASGNGAACPGLGLAVVRRVFVRRNFNGRVVLGRNIFRLLFACGDTGRA